MNKRTNKCLSIWSSLVVDHSTAVFKRYDARHPLDFYLGLDSDGARLLLLICSAEPPAQPNMKGIGFRKSAREDGKWSLLLLLKDRKLLEIFSMLCQDLIDFSDERISQEGYHSVLTRLGCWRKLLERNSNAVLSIAEIRGLVGELSALKLLINQIGAQAAVSAWNGPFGSPQDFCTDTWGCEVKTVRPAAEVVNISSEYQLDTSNYPVSLAIFEVSDAPSPGSEGRSLGELVDDLRVLLLVNVGVLDSFEERLLLSGYVDREEYFLDKFLTASPYMYKIVDPFPSIQKADLPSGISSVKYQIELSAVSLLKISGIVM
jgi:hypothetical protein